MKNPARINKMKQEMIPIVRMGNPRMITQEMVMKIPREKILQRGMGRTRKMGKVRGIRCLLGMRIQE